MPKLEIACFNLDSALIAQENGADRVELCVEMNLGGITPSLQLIKEASGISLFLASIYNKHHVRRNFKENLRR